MSIIPYLYDIDRPFRMMEREFFRPDDFHGNSPVHQPTPRNFYAPQFIRAWETLRHWDNIVRPMEQLTAAMNQMALRGGSKINASDDKFQVNIDVQHFSPEEINVKVVDGNVIVEGKHEEMRDEHGYVTRQFVRRYALPQGCLPDTVESKLSSDGVLTVTAPRVLPLPSIGEKIVPITQTGPVQKRIGNVEESSKGAN